MAGLAVPLQRKMKQGRAGKGAESKSMGIRHGPKDQGALVSIIDQRKL